MSKNATTFIQWKGTDLCMDFYCECGRHSHFDGYFAYAVECACGLIYEMPEDIKPLKVKSTDKIVVKLESES